MSLDVCRCAFSSAENQMQLSGYDLADHSKSQLYRTEDYLYCE